jgi:hypothetical protein
MTTESNVGLKTNERGNTRQDQFAQCKASSASIVVFYVCVATPAISSLSC